MLENFDDSIYQDDNSWDNAIDEYNGVLELYDYIDSMTEWD